MSTGPVERKVQASSAAAAASGLLLWILGRYVFQGTVPDVVASWVYAAVPGVLAFAAGWMTRHTSRPDVAHAPPAERGGYSAGSRTVSELPPPPPSVTAQPPKEETPAAQ